MCIFRSILLFILKSNFKVLDLFLFSPVVFGTMLVLITIATAGDGFVTPALASDLTINDLISLQDPLQDKVTICHIPDGNRVKVHDITIGDSVVADHLAHGDRIGSCFPTKEPTIIVEPPSDCISTVNGSIGYPLFILNEFPIGSVIIMGPESSELPLEIEVQAETYSIPMGFSTGEKTVTAFSDGNRNSKQDPGEVSAATTFTVSC